MVDGVCCCCCCCGGVETTGEKAEGLLLLLLWGSMAFWYAGCGEWSGLLLSASSSQKPPFFHGASVVGEVDGDMESLGTHRLEEEVDVDGAFSMVAGAEAERVCVAGMGMSGVRWMEVCRLPSREGGSGLYFCGGASVVGVGVVVGVVGLVKGVSCVVGGGWPTA